MKAARAGALTLGATVAWLLPVGLVGYAGSRAAPGQRAGLIGAMVPELLTPAVCVVAAWLIVRRVATSPTGPALAWTGGAVSFVLALDVLAWSDSAASDLPGARA
ncbi:MAG TPA: hypothetical protein VMT27_09010, partial [Actinomycetes bacterium]|nr:hypothetical protein [Actinomycetes bacterium]